MADSVWVVHCVGVNISLLFWILMILWLVLGVWRDWPSGFKVIGGNILIFVLLGILGWRVFGPAIHN